MSTVDLRYGILGGEAGATAPSYVANDFGTDLIATLPDGTLIAYDPGDIAWVLTCTALVWIMIPGLGYLYSGLVRRKNALSLLLLTLLSQAVVTLQWVIFGYSLAFSDTGSSFIGDSTHFGFRGVLEQPVPGANNKVPRIVYAVYQGQFAALVPAIFIGAACERGRIGPTLLFFFCWTTVVYCPLAYWVWNPNGWAFKLGVLDYAGGVPIEIASGLTGLAYSIYLGKRRGYGTPRLQFRPHNVSHVVIGTVFLWVGWLGFNGGSTFAANLKAAMAMFNTNFAGSIGGLTWMFLDYRLEKKWSVVGFCTGAICGLVAITPAAGFIGVPASIAVGFLASGISNLLTSFKVWFRFDDPMDIFTCHGVSGIVGLICTGIFAQGSVTFNDAITRIPGGWIDQHYIQLGYQIAWICAGCGWTFVVSYILLVIIDHIPYCSIRASEDAEIVGIDDDECGEYAYDFVHAHRDIEVDGWNIHDFANMQSVREEDKKGMNMAEKSSSEKTAVQPVDPNSDVGPKDTSNPSDQEMQQAAISPRK